MKADLCLSNADVDSSSKICETLLKSNAVAADPELVSKLYHICAGLAKRGSTIPEPQVENLWQNAIKVQKAHSVKVGLAEQWAEDAMVLGNWGQVAKVSTPPAEISIDSYDLTL